MRRIPSFKNFDRKVIYNEGNCRVTLFLEFHQFFPDNPHAGAWYTSVRFSFFLVNLLQSKRFKISPMSTLGLSLWFLFFRFIINLWHLYQVRHRERSSKILKSSKIHFSKISREFWPQAYCLYNIEFQNNCSDQNNVLNKKFIITKIVLRNFREIYESGKLCLLFNHIWTMKNVR